MVLSQLTLQSNFILHWCFIKTPLDGGVRKGALTQEQADAKLAAWLEEKKLVKLKLKNGLSKAEADAKLKHLKLNKRSKQNVLLQN